MTQPTPVLHYAVPTSSPLRVHARRVLSFAFRTVIALCIAVFTGAVIATLLYPAAYSSTAVLLIRGSAHPSGQVGIGSQNMLVAQLNQIISDPIINAALANIPTPSAGTSIPSSPSQVRKGLRAMLNRNYNVISILFADKDPVVAQSVAAAIVSAYCGAHRIDDGTVGSVAILETPVVTTAPRANHGVAMIGGAIAGVFGTPILLVLAWLLGREKRHVQWTA